MNRPKVNLSIPITHIAAALFALLAGLRSFTGTQGDEALVLVGVALVFTLLSIADAIRFAAIVKR
jgi:hypothetical protein